MHSVVVGKEDEARPERLETSALSHTVRHKRQRSQRLEWLKTSALSIQLLLQRWRAARAAAKTLDCVFSQRAPLSTCSDGGPDLHRVATALHRAATKASGWNG